MHHIDCGAEERPADEEEADAGWFRKARREPCPQVPGDDQGECRLGIEATSHLWRKAQLEVLKGAKGDRQSVDRNEDPPKATRSGESFASRQREELPEPPEVVGRGPEEREDSHRQGIA